MTPAQRTLAAVGVASVIAGIVIFKNSATTAPPLTAAQSTEMGRQMLIAEKNAPPGWDFCVMPSYYTRSCESGPMSQRWGADPGCPNSTAICGAHTANCTGDDGLTYALKDGGPTGQGYPRPSASSGVTVQTVWDQCFVQHQNPWGVAYPCNIPGPPGTQTYTVLTWGQLPPGPQKTVYGNKYHCFSLTPTANPTNVPSATPTAEPGCIMVTVTPASVCITPGPSHQADYSYWSQHP